jgi:methionine synthase II (cobalamin-independent)
MPIPTELVGSLPRPTGKLPCELCYSCSSQQLTTCVVVLQQAYADYDAGKITKDDLVKAQDQSVADSMTNLAATGETLITDGEQRLSS